MTESPPSAYLVTCPACGQTFRLVSVAGRCRAIVPHHAAKGWTKQCAGSEAIVEVKRLFGIRC